MQGEGGRERGEREREGERGATVRSLPALLELPSRLRAGEGGGREAGGRGREGILFRAIPCTQSIRLSPDIANLHISLLV